MAGRILVVDDDREVLSVVSDALRSEGYDVEEAADGHAALAAAERRPPDLVILDVMMPGLDGREVLAELRRSSQIPVMLLTSRTQELDRVAGLDMGADDYLVKPFFPRELLARVRALLRRIAPAPAPLEFGPLRIDVGGRRVTTGSRAIDLTAREFDLLAFLAARPGRAFSREDLLRDVWSSSPEWQDASTVTEHIRRIRRKLGSEDRISTIRGVGYRFEP